MRPALIIQTGNSPRGVREIHGGFGEMVRNITGMHADNIRIVRVYAGETPAAPGEYCAALITGSPANVTDHEPWSENMAGWIRSAMDVDLPLLGICYGHQLMAHALGARVDYHPRGREIGSCAIRLTQAGKEDPLLSGMPEHFVAQLIHEQSVMEAPAGATVLASNEHDPFQMLRMGERAVGVQFHPEFSAPVMQTYLQVLQPMLAREGIDVPALQARVEASPEATGMVRRFLAAYVQPASACSSTS